MLNSMLDYGEKKEKKKRGKIMRNARGQGGGSLQFIMMLEESLN